VNAHNGYFSWRVLASVDSANRRSVLHGRNQIKGRSPLTIRTALRRPQQTTADCVKEFKLLTDLTSEEQVIAGDRTSGANISRNTEILVALCNASGVMSEESLSRQRYRRIHRLLPHPGSPHRLPARVIATNGQSLSAYGVLRYGSTRYVHQRLSLRVLMPDVWRKEPSRSSIEGSVPASASTQQENTQNIAAVS